MVQKKMSDAVWTALIAAIPATVAAFSSLRNGAEQKRVKRELAAVNDKVSSANRAGKPTKKTVPLDWYDPPDLS